jgi:Tfp pilus assembly protein PilX
MRFFESQSGVSLIAAIFIIVVLAFMGVMFVSLINTGSLTSVNDMQSAQAFSIAEGGVEHAKRFLRPYGNWYAFTTDPLAVATDQSLGSGSFTTTITFPATAVRKSFGGAPTMAKSLPVFRKRHIVYSGRA